MCSLTLKLRISRSGLPEGGVTGVPVAVAEPGGVVLNRYDRLSQSGRRTCAIHTACCVSTAERWPALIPGRDGLPASPPAPGRTRQDCRVIQLLRAVLDNVAPDVLIFTEANVPHAEDAAYWGNGSNVERIAPGARPG